MTPPSDTDGKITQAEMIEMFGESMPFEAWQLIADAPPDWTLAQMRQRLREIAAERNHRDSDTDVRELLAFLREEARGYARKLTPTTVCGLRDDGYVPPKPEETSFWKAAAALESQLSHIARLEEALRRIAEPLGHGHCGNCGTPCKGYADACCERPEWEPDDPSQIAHQALRAHSTVRG